MLNSERVEKIRSEFPEGSRICLVSMGSDDPNPIPDSTIGTVKHIDDAGLIHVDWENGRTLPISEEYGDLFFRVS